MKEKIYFEDSQIKVSNLRLDCNKETFPVDQISKANIRIKIFNIVSASILFFLTLLVHIFASYIMGNFFLLFISISFIWLAWSYSKYYEIWLIFEGEELFLFDCSIASSSYINNIEKAIKEAQHDNELLQKQGKLKYTDTLNCKLKMKAYSA